MQNRQKFCSGFILLLMLALCGCGNTDSSKADIKTVTEETSQKEAQEQKDKQTETKEKEESEAKAQSQTVTGDLSVDVENGVLYSTEDGRISDKDGNPLSEYDYITITDNGSLSDSEGILEGYFVGAGGKIILDIPGESGTTADTGDKTEVPADTTEKSEIKTAEAKDENDLTGTYKDEESGAVLSLIIEGDQAMYSLGSDKEGVEPEVEQNCTVDASSISGHYYYIMKNMDGTLGITSGVGVPWGHFTKTDDSAEINLAYDLEIQRQQMQEKYDNQSPLEKLRSRASEGNCDNTVEDGIEYNGKNLNHMGDDGDYFDEVVLGTWFNEDGTPKAMFPPSELSSAMDSAKYSQLEYFDFINGEDVSLDEVKRRGRDSHWYAIILTDIRKQESDDGSIYFIGTDPISGENVVVKGNFSRILNEDDLLVFGTSMGTATDDTLNIQGEYIQNISARIGSIF